MKEFFANMESLESVYWYIAIGASLIFIILSILSLSGGGDTDVHSDIDSSLGETESPSHILSLRNLINFTLGFGWSGVAFYHSISNHFWLGTLSVLVGLVFVVIFYFIYRSFIQMAENNTFNIDDTIGKTADVYLRIPPNKSGKGKVLISIKGSVRELDAITTENAIIESGKSVKIKSIEGSNLVVSSELKN